MTSTVVSKVEELSDPLQQRKERETQKEEAAKNPNLEKLIYGFESLLKHKGDQIEIIYGQGSILLEGARVRRTDIEQFALALGRYQEQDRWCTLSGVYLSCCMNLCEDDSFDLSLSHLPKPIHYLGMFNNGKSIVINGNTGSDTGWRMQDGKITVNGNAGDFVGFEMWGGNLVVEGNAGNCVGYGMRGGVIHLNGDFQGLFDYIPDGDIYHKKELIVKRGKIV